MRYSGIDEGLELLLAFGLIVKDIRGNVNDLKHVFLGVAVVDLLSLDLVVFDNDGLLCDLVVLRHVLWLHKLLVLVQLEDILFKDRGI